MIAFTWNLHKSIDALQLACEHLARLDACVVAFQEVPRFDPVGLARWSKGGLKVLEPPVPIPTVMPAAKVLLMSSEGITVDPAGAHHHYKPLLDKNRRLAGLTLIYDARVTFQILGVHGLDVRNDREPDFPGLLRRVLDDFRGDRPLVVMGDFQYNPFDPVITGHRGLHALREKDGLRSELKLPQSTRKVRPFYNPMWPLLADRAAGAKGTYHFRNDKSGLFWHCIDQIIVSPDLKPFLEEPEILTELKDAEGAGHSLLTSKGLPDTRYSDHLPVQMTIDLDRLRP